MEASTSDLSVKPLILGPALIALAVTIIRLMGEVSGGPSALFNREAGGQGVLVGIVWLIPIFGIYFAVKLVRCGRAPESAGKVIGFAVLAMIAAVAVMLPVIFVTGDPSVKVSLGGAVVQQLGFVVASLVAVLILRKVWPAFFRTMLSYAFASRIPVVIVMFVTMIGNWNTHYELGPPGYPEMGFVLEFVILAVVPQMTFWVMVTLVFGALFGGIAAALLRSKAGGEEVAQAG